MFRLSWDEHEALRSQNVILESGGRGQHRKFTPRAFTQEGVSMLSGVLRRPKAVAINIGIMRAFVRLREMLASDKELARKVAQHDEEIAILFEHIRGLLEQPEPKKNTIGFVHPKYED